MHPQMKNVNMDILRQSSKEEISTIIEQAYDFDPSMSRRSRSLIRSRRVSPNSSLDMSTHRIEKGKLSPRASKNYLR